MSPHRGYYGEAHVRDVIHKLEARWKGGRHEIRDLRLSAGEGGGRGVGVVALTP